MTIFTLNLWRQYDWENRKPKIVEFLRTNLPDVVLLQEVQILPSGLSQVEELKNELENQTENQKDFAKNTKNSIYLSLFHSTIYPKYKEKGEILQIPKQHGMAILSKYPIINSFNYFVPMQESETEPRSVLCFDILVHQTVHKFVNIHLGNRQHWAIPQLENLLEFLEKRGETRILVGDFNLFDFGCPKNYKSSFDFENYISYPAKNWTLDYILIPQTYRFESIEIVKNLSDHFGILSKIV